MTGRVAGDSASVPATSKAPCQPTARSGFSAWQPKAPSDAERLNTALRRLGAAFAAGWQIDATLQTVVDLAAEVFGCTGGVLRLLLPDRRLVAVAACGEASAQHLLPLTFRDNEGVVGQVVTTQRPVVINQFDPTGHPYAESIAAAGINSLLCVPILAPDDGKSLGCLTIHNKLCGEPFTPDDEALLSEFASHAAIALDQALLLESERAAANEAAILHQVAQASSTLNLREVLNTACDKTLEISGARVCAILLFAEDRPELTAAQCRGLSLTSHEEFLRARFPFDPASDAAWRALVAGSPITVPDEAGSSRLARQLLDFFQEPRAGLVPLLTQRSLTGILYLDDSALDSLHQERSRRILQSVALQFATAIENARLYDQLDRKVRTLSALNRLTEVMTSTVDLPALVQCALTESARLLGADMGSIMLFDPARRTLKVEASVGLPARVVRRAEEPLGVGVAGWVGQHRLPLRVSNVAGDPRFDLQAERTEISAALCLPLIVGKDLIGVLNLSRRHPSRPFTADDQDLATTLAGQIAVAVQNASHLLAERQVAQMARRSLMPRLPLSIPGLDIGEKHVPAEDVGGDYYDVSQLPNGMIDIVVSDVSGKSVGAAMHAAMGKYFIRALSHQFDDPGQILSAANALIAAETPDEVFISLFYGILDIRSGTLHYANAGHVPPIIVRETGEVEELSSTGMLLGLFKESQYTCQSVKLSAGDVLACYTDGITEARRDQELFGDERLKSAIIKSRCSSAQKIADQIYRRTLRHCRQKVHDDIALLVLKYYGMDVRPG